MLIPSGTAQDPISFHHQMSCSSYSSSLKAFPCSLSFYSVANSRTQHNSLRTPSLFFFGFPLILSSSPRPYPIPISTATSPTATPLTEQLPEEFWEEEEENNFNFDIDEAANDCKNLAPSPVIEVKELQELPEEWRRSKIAWLCKELPAHRPGTLVRLLNAQKKWMTQENATYIAHHFMRVRQNETSFKVYKWMQQQHWFRFDFDFATKLADYMGKERKYARCRELFNEIINRGEVPSESTFHILIVAYLSAPVEGCLEEACGIYNRMIQFGGYQPRLSLHNSLFRALISKPGASAKYYLKQAEFIFHNLETLGLEIQRDIYAGMIWLHSYQDNIDTERLAALREEMQQVGFEEGKDVLLSILRAYSKEGDVEGVERTWIKILESDSRPPSQGFIYRMDVYAKVGDPMKSLEIFRGMQDTGHINVVAYHKIIEVLSEAQSVPIAETLVDEFVESGKQPLIPAFANLMNMFSRLLLHDKLETTFFKCLEKCRPNRTIYNIYLDSLVKTGNLGKATDIFNQMLSNEAIGVNSRSCNNILSGHLDAGKFSEAKKIYYLMCQKKYTIEPLLMDKLDDVLSLKKGVVEKPITLKLSKEQREILIGLLLGGLQIHSGGKRKNHAILFEFSPSSTVHSVLKRHIHDHYHEWLPSFSRQSDEDENIPHRFCTIAHYCFGFYADQFWPKGKPSVPKLLHRWLSPRVLAYWYMYGGHRTPSGDILLKLKGADREDVEKIVRSLKVKSLDCKIKRKGRVFWIGFLGTDAVGFWKVVELHILDDLKDLLRANIQSLENREDQGISFESESDFDNSESEN